MELISLLQCKNRCLQRFLELTRSFHLKAETEDFEGLAEFERQREVTLKAIDLYDRKISEYVRELPDTEKTPTLIDSVKKLLSEKEDIIHSIIDLDLKVISLIEKEKNRLLKELSRDKKGKQTLSKFKSQWISEPGEGFDRTL